MKSLLKQSLISTASWLGPHKRKFPGRKSSLWILMYHRILPREDLRYSLEEPGMIVQPDCFEMHLREIKKYFDIVDLSNWLAAKQAGEKLPERACAITFDDGWHDNFEFALPILRHEQVPATLFSVAEKIGTNFQFWPNIISALVASGAGAILFEQPEFAKPLSQAPSAINEREYCAQLINNLKQLSDTVIFNTLERLKWHEQLNFDMPRALMTWEELQKMQECDQISIGSHTCNHLRLNADLPYEKLYHEIVNSKQLLATKLKSEIDIFCFPNGDYNKAALNLVKENYRAAVTTKSGIVNAYKSESHELTRIGVHQDVSETPQKFGARLSGWI